MRNILRVVMLVLIAVAVYFAVTFLIASNKTYPETVPEDKSFTSGEISQVEETLENEEVSGEEEVISGEAVVETSGELEEDVLGVSENSGEIANEESTDSGEIIENAIVDPSGDYQYEKIEDVNDSGEQDK